MRIWGALGRVGVVLTRLRARNLSVVVMAALLLIVKLKAEEALLTRQFPDAYPLYQRRVKAIIPFLY